MLSGTVGAKTIPAEASVVLIVTTANPFMIHSMTVTHSITGLGQSLAATFADGAM